ncbi:MAG: hypothetical protein GY853_16535 [PVC group bacterium]|nr:hypothetical protein [PVC group bacterium]
MNEYGYFEFNLQIYTKDEEVAKRIYNAIRIMVDHPDMPESEISLLWQIERRVVKQ